MAETGAIAQTKFIRPCLDFKPATTRTWGDQFIAVLPSCSVCLLTECPQQHKQHSSLKQNTVTVNSYKAGKNLIFIFTLKNLKCSYKLKLALAKPH